ncbi:anthranilate phosphoribosyltransferase [Shewanella sp. NIFS-20-20]|uniref:anthranilate phosphoribosyltransferase n=1 Tax=Shewanella sp. NIFS-20-20 TaxID=2853806 RepID=UPI001C43856F|nr:anthranilate phosphoribosyltransferase [Shewanella sp. NIFS-20-20]MBV7315041.1 anthranilate phosphoribosyltransferase [Shewanella sp. NIFS-20-20]
MTDDIQANLALLFQQHPLSRQQSEQLFSAIIQGQLNESQIAATLIALKIKGESLAEISGAADALLGHATLFPRRPEHQGVLDIVGTGGDGFNTINISTTAALVAAASGAMVAKHGNRSVSSQSGSSDLLANLGVNLTLAPDIAADCLAELGICFIFAPQYHAGVKHAVPVRQALKTRTIFNILGPLINPARPDFMVLGVYCPSLLTPIAQCLQALGVKRAMVVHGSGLDEVAIHGITQVVEIHDEKLKEYQLTPQDLGVNQAAIDDLTGGSPAQNAKYTLAILQGQGQPAHRDAVAVNAGCALYVAGIAPTPKAGTALALATLANQSAWERLQQLIAYSNTTTQGCQS